MCCIEGRRKRPVFSNLDRLISICRYRIAPQVLDALKTVEPETVLRWHRTGFRLFSRWKSRRRVGRPRISLEVRRLIREMSLADPLWGAPRIHGELLKLGVDVGQTSVAKYMARRRRLPSEGWRTFLLNHVFDFLWPAAAPSFCLRCAHRKERFALRPKIFDTQVDRMIARDDHINIEGV
jgi:hypothetical protein